MSKTKEFYFNEINNIEYFNEVDEYDYYIYINNINYEEDKNINIEINKDEYDLPF